MKPVIAVGMLTFNEAKYVPYSIGAIYGHVDHIVVVDSFSTDGTPAIIKALDKDNKITIIQRKWDNNYSNARNTYLDYFKKNFYPKYRNHLYYMRIDADEIYYASKMEGLKSTIEENPDKSGFRFNFYAFDKTYHTLNEVNPTESRACVFRYSPDIRYLNPIHEIPCHTPPSGPVPLYGDPRSDKDLGVMYLPGFWYAHFAWCDVKRCFTKAKNYTQHYVAQGTETKERLATVTDKDDSWWWTDHKSSMEFKGHYPEIFKELGYFEGQVEGGEGSGRPKISAFTIVKNAVKFDYPIIEAIKSVLPIADEVIVNLGDSEDATSGLLHKMFDGIEKVRFFDSVWEGRDQGTAFLRNQTNLAKSKCKNEVCLYFQADEVYHSKDYEKILKVAEALYERKDLVGAIFNYYHFDGLPTFVNKDSYPKEVRLIKRDAVDSIGDAQSFGLRAANLTNVMTFRDLLLDSEVECFHYGWLRDPEKMLQKLQDFDGYYHDDKEMHDMHGDDLKKFPDGKYDYGKKISNFTGTHPSVMAPRLRRYEKENSDICEGNCRFEEAWEEIQEALI